MKNKISLLSNLLFAFSFLFALAASFTTTEKNMEFIDKSAFDHMEINRKVPSAQNQIKSDENKQARLGTIGNAKGNTFLQNTTIYDNYLKGNMLILGDYALMPQSIKGLHPTIKKLCLSTMKYETIEYTEEQEYLHEYQLSSIADLHNGDIAYGRGEFIYILNKTTLQMKQKIPAPKYFYLFFNVIKFNVFNDKQSGRSRILVSRGQIGKISSVWQLKKISGGKMYEQTFLFYFDFMFYLRTIDFNLYITEENKGLSLMWSQVIIWQNFNDGITYSEDRKYILEQRKKIAVSHSETFFVARKNSTYEVYDFDQDYQLTLKQSIPTNFNQTQKGELTSDDKNLFLIMSNIGSNITFAKVTLDNGQITYIDNLAKGIKIVNFHLFPSETDRIVTLLQQGSKYSLQLRSISDLRVIHQIPLSFSFIAISFKLLGNIEWGSYFALAVRYTPYLNPKDNSYVYQYKLDNDRILSTQIISTFGMETVQAGYRYIIDYEKKSRSVSIFHFSNFTLAHVIQTEYFEELVIQNNIMLAIYRRMIMYDLSSSSLESLGTFYLGITQVHSGILLALPNRGIITYLQNRDYQDYFFPTAAFYNISVPQVKTEYTFEQYPTAINSIYFEVQPKSQCNKIYYISQQKQDQQTWPYIPKIIEYDECSKAKRKYTIDYEKMQNNLLKIFVSSDKKYLILVIPQREDRPFNILVEVRERQNLGNIVFRHQFTLGQLYDYHQTLPYLYADVLNSSQLLIKSVNFIFSTAINAQGKSTNLSQQK